MLTLNETNAKLIFGRRRRRRCRCRRPVSAAAGA